MSVSALANAVEYLANCGVGAVRFHAARSLGCPRRFGPIRKLREEAERDMFARDVRELFLLPYAEALRTGRLRGEASGIVGRVLSSNASVAIDAMVARGCLRPGRALAFVLDEMIGRAHPLGFFHEPYQAAEVRRLGGDPSAQPRYLFVTALYVRYLLAFGRGRDPRVRRALDWLVRMQGPDGAWRLPGSRDGIEEYQLTRTVAAAFAELTATALRRYASSRRRLAAAWSDRILPRCQSPDAVITELNIASSSAAGELSALPKELENRILYFPLEDLWLALTIGASPKHPHLEPWIAWLEDSQLADGSWRLQNPQLRERLLLSDPNGRLRAEALYLTDEWITLRGAQILAVARRRARAPAGEVVPS